MVIECFGKLGCLDAVAPPLSRVHSGLMTVEWLAALCPRAPSCLCHLLVLPCSYAVLASLPEFLLALCTTYI